MSQTKDTFRAELDDIEVLGVPGSHAMVVRHFDDTDDVQTFSFDGPEQIHWVADKLQEVGEGLPFECEWEIGVCEAGDPDNWEHYHPHARTEEEANKKAREEAQSDFTDPQVYMTSGPFPPEDPVKVGEEMIERVFDSPSDV